MWYIRKPYTSVIIAAVNSSSTELAAMFGKIVIKSDLWLALYMEGSKDSVTDSIDRKAVVSYPFMVDVIQLLE